jgi:hypothetical protein
MKARKLVVVPPSTTWVEWFHAFLAGCDVIEVGTDIAPHYPVIHHDSSVVDASLFCKTPPSTADLIVNVNVTVDGDEFQSIFPAGTMTFPQGRTTPVFTTEFSDAGKVLVRGAWLTFDCIQSGGAQGVSLKIGGRSINRSQATATETGGSEYLLVL